MNSALFLSRRLRLRSDNSGSSKAGVVIGIVGVSLSVFIMLIAISVVSGFKNDIISRLRGFNSDITIYAPSSQQYPGSTPGLRLTDSLVSIISQNIPEAKIAVTLRQPAIIKTENDFQGIILKGSSATNDGFIDQYLVKGTALSADSTTNSIIISKHTADALSLDISNSITAHFLNDNGLKTRKFNIVGIYDTHFHDFDQTVAFVPLKVLQNLNKLDSLSGTAVEITGISIDKIDAAANELSNSLLNATLSYPTNPMIYNLSTVNQTCAVYFNWLDLLDTNVVVIILLMSFVSAFTLISSLFIIILQRVKTIGLLKALGTTNYTIRQVFILMSFRIVLIGLVIGNILALCIIYLQSSYQLIPLDPDSYYLSYVPMHISGFTIAIVNLSAIVIAGLILILPSHIISRISPAKSLRYE